MIVAPDLSGQLALDSQALDGLRAQAKRDPDAALKAAAKQFEALFLSMMLKSMREATPRDGMLESDQTRMYTSMLDMQLAQALSARGVGLADSMVQQLARQMGKPDAEAMLSRGLPGGRAGGAMAPAGIDMDTSTLTPRLEAPAPVERTPRINIPPGARRGDEGLPAESVAAAEGPVSPGSIASVPANAREFVNRMWPHAVEASRETGIPPHFMIAQAALESGWGKREIRHGDGSTSHNLFGIKANRSWGGAAVEATTTEFVNGTAEKSVERFRAYGSYAESFRDYANMLRSSPRYAGVIERARDAEGFARGLQQAGYATDPQYADKLLRIINGSVLRTSLAG